MRVVFFFSLPHPLTTAFKLAQAKLPVKSEFITRDTPPRLGNIVSEDLRPPPAAQTSEALLLQMAEKGHNQVLKKLARRSIIQKREEEREFASLKVVAPLMVSPPTELDGLTEEIVAAEIEARQREYIWQAEAAQEMKAKGAQASEDVPTELSESTPSPSPVSA